MEKPVQLLLLGFHCLFLTLLTPLERGNFAKSMHGWACLEALVLNVSFNFSGS